MNTKQHNLLLYTLFCLFILIRPIESLAKVIYVDDSSVCGGTCDGTSWALAYPSLQTALGTSIPGDIIYVAGGTYYPDASDRDISFEIPSGVQLYGGYDGFGTPGSRNSSSVLSGAIGTVSDTDNSYTVVYFEDASQATLLDGFTITNGNSNSVVTDLDHRHGGGIYITATSTNSCDPVIRDCIITGNNADNNGGGVYVYGGGFSGSAYPQFNGCTISNNVGSLGGGMFNDGNLCTANPVIINCDFNNNEATSTGGGVYNFGKAGGSAGATVVNTIFQNNTAGSAGGFYSLASGSASAVSTITNCTFYANYANVGGATYVNEEPGSTTQTTITNSIYWGSTAGFHPLFHYSGDGTPEIIISYSIVDAADCASIKFGIDVTCGAGMLYNQNPLFVNGYDLDVNSPAVNAGDNNTIGNTGVSVDIHSDSRIQMGMVDLGVDETPYGLVLPVELVNFDVKNYTNNSALLIWNTASEIDNDYFTIEHSRDGIAYEGIGKVHGAGTTDRAQSYSFIDDQPFQGINYYRLKQTDFDGQYSYSEVRTLVFDNKDHAPSVYPNPADEVLFVDLGGSIENDATRHYAIFDWSGKQIATGQLQSAYGLANVSLNNNNLQSGVYLLKVEGLAQSFKFVKR
jgi:hypothetical protein